MADGTDKIDPEKPVTGPEGIHFPDQQITASDGSILVRKPWVIDSQYVDVSSGIAPWCENNEKLNFNKNDHRFQACLETAHALKEKYPNHDVESEAAITKVLVAEIHKQYGNYDEKDDGNYLYGEGQKGNIIDLGKFARNHLVCREYAYLASVLSSEAGIDNVLVIGSAALSVIGKNQAFNYATGVHAFVFSKHTGNRIEAVVDDPNMAYGINLSGGSARDIIDGKILVTKDAQGNVSLYSTNHIPDEKVVPLLQEGYLDQRDLFNSLRPRELLATVNKLAGPSPVASVAGDDKEFLSSSSARKPMDRVASNILHPAINTPQSPPDSNPPPPTPVVRPALSGLN